MSGVRFKLRYASFLILSAAALRPTRAAVAMVQHAGRDAGTTTSSTLAFTSNNTAGNFIAVAVRAGRTGQNVTVSDTRGNVYRRAFQASATLDAVTLAIYYAENISGGANTVTVSDTLTDGSLRFAILEYSGVATSSALDGAPVMAEGTSASMSSGATTTTASGDLVLGLFSTSDPAAFTAGGGAAIEERVPTSGTKLAVQDLVQGSAGPVAAQATISPSQPWAAVVAAFRAASGPAPVPDLTIAKSHAGSFTRGQTGATYTLTVSNTGTGPTSGTVSVVDTLPSGLTATALSGTGWSCSLGTLTCTRADALAVSSSYPAITLAVSVSATAPASVTNAAAVSGGGQTNTGNDTATDPTTINPGGGPSPVAMIQHAGIDAGTTTSSSLAFPQANTAGNFIAVAIRAGRPGQSFTITDTRGNTYRQAVRADLTLDTVTLGLYYAENIAAGTNTVTVTDTISGGTMRFAIVEYSGVATSSALDGTPAKAEGNSTSLSSGPTTTTTAGDLVLGVFSTADPASFTAGGGATIQEWVPAPPNAKLVAQSVVPATAGPVAALATIAPAQPWAAAVAAFRAGSGGGSPLPDLTLAKTHTGFFEQAQTGATYALTVTNVGGAATSGTVTVTDTLPTGLTATAFAGAGWSCTLSPLSCSRSDALGTGGSYPALTLTVNVASSAPATVTNAASVSGGGQTNTGNDAATDPTTVTSFGSPRIGRWSSVQNWPIVAVHAALLPTGDVLAWTDYTTNEGAQIWRRATNTFTPKTYTPVSLFCAGHAYLPDGRLLVAGGIVGLQDDLGPRETTFFDPATESWSAGPLMLDGRYYPTTTTLGDGRILVAGGTTTCSTCFADDVEIYDPAANSWTPLAASAQHTFKYYPHLYVLPDGRILLAGQDDKAVASQVLDLTTQTWTTLDPSIVDGHSSAMYLPGKVMKCGKATADAPGQAAAATTYVLDTALPSPAWQATGSMAFPRSHHNLTILPDGKVLVTGGGRTTDKADFATAVHEAELWSPTTKTWSTMAAAQNPRLYHSTALLLPDATVLVAGGGRQNGRSQPDPKDQANAEIYAPPYLFRGPRPAIGSAPATLTYGTSFQVTTPDAARIASISLIPLSAVTHSYNETQRFVPLSFTTQSGALTVTAPASGNIAPPGPYMLFLVDDIGVPSVAAMVRLPAPALDTQPPSTPGNLQASVAGSNVNLTWSPSSDNVGVTGYNVHRSTTSGFTPTTANRIAAPPTTSYTDTPPGPGTYYYKVAARDLRGNVSTPSAQATATIAAPGVPDLTVAKSHAGAFTQGQTGATYAITVSNAGTAPTSGTVSVVDTLPSGLTATGLSGTGWSCALGSRTCTRTDALAAAASYPAITLTVSVSASAPASVTNSATVSGGGQSNTANDGASDPTTINPSGGGPATIAMVQHAGLDAGTTTTAALAFPQANTAGNFIVVAIRAGRTGQSFTLTDTRGNAYRQALQINESLDTVTLGLYYAENVAGGNNTVTVTDTIAGGTLRFAIFEYSGVATVSALDGSPVVAEGTSGAPSSGPIITSSSGDLLFGMISTSDTATYSPGSGFTLQEQVPAPGIAKLVILDRRLASPGSASVTATISPAQAWGAAAVAFRPGPGPNGPKLIVTAPAEGASIPGTTVNVAYGQTGDPTEVNHVHYQLDTDPVVMDLTLDGVFQYGGVHVGPHTLYGVLVRSDHSPIAGSASVPIHFTTIVDPGDPVAPTVQMTSPTGGTVSGIVTIAANANDNLGVYGVQFLVDGVRFGAEDLVGPYEVEWNTATVANGAHTLTAIARDAAGRETTSAPVTVTVSNVSPTDPSVIGQFAGPFAWPLVSVHAILLPTGKVLLFDDHTTSAGVQVWSPATNTMVSRPYAAKNLFCSGHALLPDGRVLVIGGHVGAYVGIPDVTIFNPATETWSAAASMSQARWYPTATSLPDGRVLALSGADNCPSCVDPNGSHDGIALIPEVYNPLTNAWAQLGGASLSLPLYPHVHVLTDGRVLAVATQEDPINSRALDISTQTWTILDPVVRDGGSSVTYRPGQILKTGMGRNPDYAPVPSSATAYVMDTTAPNPVWRSIPSMSFPRTQHNLVVLPDGNVLAVGGSTNSNVFDPDGTVKTAELWNATTETWTAMATMQEPRHYHSTALLLPDGRVLVAGGGRFGPDFPSAEIYSPPYLFKGPRPVITSVPAQSAYGSHFTVSTPDAARVAKVSLIRLGAVTHAFDENQRYSELPFTSVAGGLDVTAPASANLVPPGHYMLFLVDSQGIPSTGSIVRFPAPWETVP